MRNELIDLYNKAVASMAARAAVIAYREARDRIGPQIVMREVLDNDTLRARLAEVEAQLTRAERKHALEKDIADALQECTYVSGVKAGWNAALIKDDAEAQKKYESLTADPCRRLKVIRDAREALAKLEAHDGK